MTNSDNRIFFGGKIITINDNEPFVEAVGIKGEKIVSVGSLESVKLEMGENCVFIDLKGNVLLPGFIDSHIHIIGSIFLLLYPNLKNVKNLKELQYILKEEAALREPGELLLAFDLDEEKLEKPLIPTKWDLDEACPDTPVFIFRHDLHIGIANSKLLELLDIEKDTIAPEGGEIRKNFKGEITGVLTEKAINNIFKIMNLPDSETIKKSADHFFLSLAEKGITSIHGVLELDRKGGVDNLGGIALPILKMIQEMAFLIFYFLLFQLQTKN